MNLLSDNAVEVGYLVSAVCFVLALQHLSSARIARRGNLIGSAGAVVALLTVFLATSSALEHTGWILLAIGLGTVIAVPVARGVRATHRPQLVALLNGLGGGAAAVVALMGLAGLATDGDHGRRAAIAGAVLIGAVSCSGSVVAALRLQEIVAARPVVLPGAAPLLIVGLVVGVGLGAAIVATANLAIGLLLLAAALILGVMAVLPVGSGDVPIVISLLNALTGFAVAAGGLALDNTLLLVAGTLVGAAGTTLTRRMAAAMGRSVLGVLFGALREGASAGSGAGPAAGSAAPSSRPVRSVVPDDVAILLGRAATVVVVPGYGFAVAQAQHALRELADVLEARGTEVRYAVHPGAGRMPGHMNVLLSEANVSYEALAELDEINPEFAAVDVVLVVGANDVVNPAARTDPGAPIYGMPILKVSDAQQVVFVKRSTGPGFAGIDNELFHDPKASLLLGDVKDSLSTVVGAVRNL